MKKWNLLVPIWTFLFISTLFLSISSYKNGQLNEALSWAAATIAWVSLIIYHFKVSSKRDN
jgi:hypothetical protein